MNPIKQWWRDRLRETTETRIQDIRADFDIIEKDGSLFLTHRGDAFFKINEDTCSRSVALMLENARQTAITFRGYGTDQSDTETAPV